MKIDLSTSEIYDLLKEGSTNQRNFINSLRFSEFKEFIEEHEMFLEEYDLRGLINGGVLVSEETDQINEDHCIFSNGRVTISLYWNGVINMIIYILCIIFLTWIIHL